MKAWHSYYHDIPSNVGHYDMLTDHVMFNMNPITRLLPGDSKFVTIMRDPATQFASALTYYAFVFNVTNLLSGLKGMTVLFRYVYVCSSFFFCSFADTRRFLFLL